MSMTRGQLSLLYNELSRGLKHTLAERAGYAKERSFYAYCRASGSDYRDPVSKRIEDAVRAVIPADQLAALLEKIDDGIIRAEVADDLTEKLFRELQVSVSRQVTIVSLSQTERKLECLLKIVRGRKTFLEASAEFNEVMSLNKHDIENSSQF